MFKKLGLYSVAHCRLICEKLDMFRRLIKPITAAVALVLIISLVSIYILPQYVYINPFSKFYNSGVVDHKSIGEGTDNNGNEVMTYTVSVRLLNDDPLNHISGGETLAYIVTKAEWDMIAPQDTVKIEMLPNAHAQVLEIIPVFGITPDWRLHLNSDIPLKLTLTADKQNYFIGETAYFTVRLTNDNSSYDGPPKNISLSLFKDCIYFILNGNLVSSNSNMLNYDGPTGIQHIILQPNQDIDYSFSWNITNVEPGNYGIRAYVGYYASLETISLTETILIDVSE